MRLSGMGFGTVALAGLLALGACGGGGDGPAPAATNANAEAQYSSQTIQFRNLQKAGLAGDYAGFARHLRADSPETVITQLQGSFRGRGFDVYTWKTEATDARHERLVELRNSTGRLYLYLRLDRVTGGWYVADWDMGRNRAAITARL